MKLGQPSPTGAPRVAGISLTPEQNEMVLKAHAKLEAEIGTRLTRGQVVSFLAMRVVGEGK
jgi:hypothetical protein